MNLKNLKNVKFQISEQTKMESQIYFLIGIMIGALSSWVLIMFFTPWEWYFKLFATIGEIGIIGSLGLALQQALEQRRAYIDAKKTMESVGTEQEEEMLGDEIELTAQELVDEVESK